MVNPGETWELIKVSASDTWEVVTNGTWEERGKLVGNIGAQIGLAKGIGKLSATAEAAARVRVIGHFPAYLQFGEQLGAKVFSIPPAVWDKMTDAERWAANVKFLERAIAEGADFVLATSITQVKPGSALRMEIDDLLSRGYKLSDDGTRLIKG